MTWTNPDDPTSDSAMASGADAGEPGGHHLGPGDLSPEEERLLAALERDARGGPVLADDATVAAVRAPEDERRLPGRGGDPDDGLTPRFTAPDFE
jgi:hypothetical protein